MISDELKLKILNEYTTTKKTLGVIASEIGISIENATKILQEFKEEQPPELIEIINAYRVEPTKYNAKVKLLIKKEKKQKETNFIQEQYDETSFSRKVVDEMNSSEKVIDKTSLSRKILFQFATTKKHLRAIAKENGISYEEAIVILQKFKEEQPPELIELINEYSNKNSSYQSRINKFIKEEKKQRETPPIEEQYGEIIYELRKKSMTYKKIRDVLEEEYGINVSETSVRLADKNFFYKKSKSTPKREVDSAGNESSKVLDQMIYKLREYGLTYATISKILKERGIEIVPQLVARRCKEIYEAKKIAVPEIRDEIVDIDKYIYFFKEHGLTFDEITQKLNLEGIDYRELEGRYTKMIKYKQKQLAKVIVDFMLSKNATVEQMQKMAEYYGVDLEKTMESLEER